MTHNEYLAVKRFPALDGMRAIAALLVVTFHYGGPSWERANGWIGVHLFFALSGFLITTLALREEDCAGRVSLVNFSLRRAFRILPVYYTVLAAVVLLTYLRGELQPSGLPEALPYFALFLNEYHVIGTFGQAWTLGVEQKFYLVWPLIAFGITLTFATRLTMALGLAAAMLALIPVLPYCGAYAPILFGCALAITLHHPRGFALLRPFTHPATGALLVAAIVLVQTHLAEISDVVGDRTGSVGVQLFVVLVCLLIPSLLAGRGPITWLLYRAPLRFVGERSYSLYLVQGIAGILIAAAIPQLTPPRTLTAVAVTTTALLIADVLHRWIEIPAIDLGRRTIARLKKRNLPPRHRRSRNLSTGRHPNSRPSPHPVASGR